MEPARKAETPPMTCYEQATSWMENSVTLAKRPTNVVFGENLDRLMKAHKPPLEQQDLAEKLGVSQATVSRWLSGKSDPPFEKLDEMSKLFDEPVIGFFRDIGDPRGLGFDEEDAFRLLREKIRDRKKGPADLGQ